MSEFRELQAKLEKIEESYYSRLAAAIDDLVTANPEADPVTLVRLARSQLGDDAAKYLSDKLESEGDFLDYDSRAKAANKPIRRHMKKFNVTQASIDAVIDKSGRPSAGYLDEAGDELFVNDELHLKINAELKKINPRYKATGYGPGDTENLINVLVDGNEQDWEGPSPYFKEMHKVFDKNTGTFLSDDDANKASNSHRYSKEEADDFGFGEWLGQNPFESIEEGWPQREETYNEMVDYWKQSLSSSIVSKGLFTQMYDAANQNIEELNAAIEEEAWSIADSYHGSGEGIGSSDQNYFIVSIARQLGIEDIFGWNKPGEKGLEESVGKIGCTGCDEVSTEAAWEKNDGSCPKCNDSTQGVAEAIVKDTEAGRCLDCGRRNGQEHKDNCNMTGLDEARGRVVEVPPELRGDDASNTAGATSRDAERFLADLGPDDDVSHDVVDPETGELLDWPTAGLDHDKDTDWRAEGGTKRERGKTAWEKKQSAIDAGDDAPIMVYYSGGSSFGSGADHAHDFLDELQNGGFYNIVWRQVSELVDDPDSYYEKDYDIDINVPVAIKRKDGHKFTSQDRENMDEVMKAVKDASPMGNVGLGYAGTTGGGTTARFYPSFF